MTQVKFTQLKNKLERLITSRPAVAAEVARLGDLGDFSENAGYQFAKGKLRGINNSIQKLEAQLNQAEIINSEKTDMVQIGSVVTLESGDIKKTYQILGSSETNPKKGIISHLSPLGAALIGKKVGATISVAVTGKEKTYQITEIQ